MRTSISSRSHSRELSFDNHFGPDDIQEVLAEECWTGPPPLPPKNEPSWPRAGDRSSRTFLSTFSLPAAAWRPSPASARAEHRQPHYQTVSSSLSQRRATVDSAIPREFAPSRVLPELPRRYSENGGSARPSSRIGGVKRKPVPALAIEDDLETVDDPHWDGKASVPVADGGFSFEERVRSLSLGELFPGETGLGFLVKEVDPLADEKQPFGRMGRSDSANSKTKSTGSSLCDSDSLSNDSYSLPMIDTIPYASNSSSALPSTRSSSLRAFEPAVHEAKPRRPFALVRRRQSRPLEAHGSIIPSLASRSAPSKQEEDDLMDAWMEIMAGGEEESPKDEKPALVFQSRPRMRTSSSQDSYSRSLEAKSRSRPESIASLANMLPPLRYISASRRTSVISLPPLDVSEGWQLSEFEVREDSEDGSDEFHDAKSWTSDHQMTPLHVLEPVPESPVPNLVPPPRSSSLRFSPLLDQTNFSAGSQQAKPTMSPQPPPPPQTQHVRTIPHPEPEEREGSAPVVSTKRRHSRSLSLDFLSSSANKMIPPRPPKSARRLSRTETVVKGVSSVVA